MKVGVYMDREQRTAKQQELCEKMVTYLPLLRKSLGITQNGLAKKARRNASNGDDL
jgi:hypothetical protein